MLENPIKNLRLISYNEQRISRQLPEDPGSWFLAEACARHVFVTLDPNNIVPELVQQSSQKTKKREETFAEDKSATRVEMGEDAYCYLLMVTTGLLSKHLGDPHSKGKIVRNFEAYIKGEKYRRGWFN